MDFSKEKLGEVLSILYDKTYSDKRMAVVREYCCNAIDEHKIHCPMRPIEIQITNNEWSVRDFGAGLDKHSIFNVFGKFFESTKRGENQSIGGFGMGSKSGHAYTDAFFVHSYQNGLEYQYACVKEAVDGVVQGVTKLINTVPTEEENGIKIVIPLKSSSERAEFNLKTLKFCRFANFPILVNGRDDYEKFKSIFTHENIHFSFNQQIVYIRVGSVVYDIKNLDFKDFSSELTSGFVIEAPIGSVNILRSREGLEGTAKTNKFLKEVEAKLRKFIDEEKQKIIENISSREFLARCIWGKPSAAVLKKNYFFWNSLKNKLPKLYPCFDSLYAPYGKDNGDYRFKNISDKKDFNLFDYCESEAFNIFILKSDDKLDKIKKEFFNNYTELKEFLVIKDDDFNIENIDNFYQDIFVDCRNEVWPKPIKVCKPRPKKEKKDRLVKFYKSNGNSIYGDYTKVGLVGEYIRERGVKAYDFNGNAEFTIGPCKEVIYLNTKSSLKVFAPLLPTVDEFFETQKENVIAAMDYYESSELIQNVGNIPNELNLIQSAPPHYNFLVKMGIKYKIKGRARFKKETNKFKRWAESDCPLATLRRLENSCYEFDKIVGNHLKEKINKKIKSIFNIK